ncbi:MAG: hypothetical protein PVG49_09385 [Desulfobacteraceae bacterium]|jgi:hypothetical protein
MQVTFVRRGPVFRRDNNRNLHCGARTGAKGAARIANPSTKRYYHPLRFMAKTVWNEII